MKKVFEKWGVVAAAALLPFLAMAQGIGTPPLTVPIPQTPGPISSFGSIIGLLNTVLGWVATIFWIAAAIFIFYAAFLYLTASGDQEKVQKASHTFLYAVVAIAVGLMAYGLPVLINSFLGGR